MKFEDFYFQLIFYLYMYFRLRGLLSLVNRGQWPKFLKSLHESGSKVPGGPR